MIRLLPWQLLWVSDMGFFEVVVLLIQRYYKFFLEGCKNTIILALFSVALGALGGTLLSLMRMSKFKVLKYPAVAIVEFVRGTPLMVQLMFIFYGLPMIGVTFPDISFIPNFSRFMAGVVAMSLTHQPMYRKSSGQESRLWTQGRWKPPVPLASPMENP